MKRLNVNAIRTCHYPQPRAFYELCDSLGFYVYDEANIESHGMGYGEKSLAKNPDWFAKHKDRTLNMYMRTRNYPCVTLLSLGNEAGMGVNFLRTYRMLKEMEAGKMDRPVLYERTEGKEGTDVHCPMYPEMPNLRYELEDDPVHKPYIACEYSHAMGNSNGSFDLMWQLFYSHPRMQGGCIWDWVDQGLAVIDSRGRKYWTYGGDYGDPEKDSPWWWSDRNFNCNGVVSPDLDIHPAGAEIKHWYQNVWISAGEKPGEFKALNRNYFRSLSDYQIKWELYRDGLTVKEGSVALATAPQASENFTVDLSEVDETHNWFINFTAFNAGAQPALEDGYPLASDQIILNRIPAVSGHEASGRVKTIAKKDRIVLKARRSRLVFDPVSGRIVSFRSRGRNLIDRSFGLKPNFWRAPIDNDWGNKYPIRAAEWKNDPAVKDVTLVNGDNSASIVAEYALPYGCSMTVKYALQYGGDLHISFDFKGSEEKPAEVARIGFRTRMKASDDRFRYFGRGPVENYIDRNTAAFLGLYEGSAKDELYPYVRPQESGHHSECDWLEIGYAKVIAGDKPFEFNALRASIEDLDPRNEDGSRIWAHVNDIPVRDYVELCIDGAMTGVGGYDSWGAKPEPSRTLFSNGNYSYSFTIGRK
jgi:beta-galactosidase